jgi:hypothetical protein
MHIAFLWSNLAVKGRCKMGALNHSIFFYPSLNWTSNFYTQAIFSDAAAADDSRVLPRFQAHLVLYCTRFL